MLPFKGKPDGCASSGLRPAGRSNDGGGFFFDFFSSKKSSRLAALLDILGISDKKSLRGNLKKISPTPYLTVQTTNSVVWTHCNDNCDFFAAFLTSIIFYGRPRFDAINLPKRVISETPECSQSKSHPAQVYALRALPRAAPATQKLEKILRAPGRQGGTDGSYENHGWQ